MNSFNKIPRLVMLAVVLAGMCSACGPPPPETASAETSALEPYLLSADDVGSEFVWREGGEAGGAGAGHLCPDTDVSIGEFSAVRAWFTVPNSNDETSIEEFLWAGDANESAALMANLKTAFSECDGVEWDYFGEKIVLELIEAPLVGDDRVAVRQIGPTTGDVLETLRVYVRDGDVMATVEVSERRDNASSPLVDKARFEDIVTRAINKLPD